MRTGRACVGLGALGECVRACVCECAHTATAAFAKTRVTVVPKDSSGAAAGMHALG